MSEHNRRAEDAHMGAIFDRLTALESEVKHLAPKVEVMEQIHELRRGQEKLGDSFFGLNKTVELLGTKMEGNYSKLTDKLEVVFGRMGAVNEENMKKLAAQAEEAHAREMAEKDAEILRIKAEAEDRKFSNQIKNIGAVLGGIMGVVAFIVWMLRLLWPLITTAN